jgi:hypothetical protein
MIGETDINGDSTRCQPKIYARSLKMTFKNYEISFISSNAVFIVSVTFTFKYVAVIFSNQFCSHFIVDFVNFFSSELVIVGI